MFFAVEANCDMVIFSLSNVAEALLRRSQRQIDTAQGLHELLLLIDCLFSCFHSFSESLLEGVSLDAACYCLVV